MTNTPFADSALDYALRGWRVFKIPPGEKIPRDRWRHGCPWEVATSWPREIEHRADRYPDHNIGIATGRGLAVLDIDPQNGGKIPNWCPDTLAAHTPSGGWHLYYRVTAPVKNSAGALAPGVDVRGDGGMVLAPPSQTSKGSYEWLNDRPTATLEPALLAVAGVATGRGLDVERKPPREVRHGEFHSQILSWAGHFASQGLDDIDVYEQTWAVVRQFADPVLEPDKVDKCIRWVLERENAK